ncbi:MAG TPA: PD-(D/E)XK nuclease family protein [Gaiellaceae bacterium]|nr:PD-(D/E)XK nuclease family protein [Gaiellaceae bacterium]
MPLALLVGPANAGKVSRLLDRYLECLHREPFLVVPNRAEVDRVERDLLARRPALLGGAIGTFDDLFELIARADGCSRPVATEAQRALVLRRALAGASLDGLGPSSRFAGFGESLLGAISELEAGLVDPGEIAGDLAALYAAYRDELDRLALSDRDLERRRAVERVEEELEAWSGRPVLAYGFEDLTGAQWALLRALAGRADVTVSLPYEPGRPAFASLARTADDLAGLADGRVDALPPAYGEIAHPALAHLERALFAEGGRPDPPALEGAVRFLEGAGSRGALELVADEILALLRAGTAPEAIGVVCPSLDRVRAPLETAFATADVPFALEGRVRLGQTPFGHALLSALRFLWGGGERRDLFGFLRSPYSGLPRAHADYLEGRLRGLGVRTDVEERAVRLRGQPLPVLDEVRAAGPPVAAVRALVRAMLRGAYGLDRPPVGEASRLDLRCFEGVSRLLRELEGWADLTGEIDRDDVLAAVERLAVRPAGPAEPGRVAVLDLLRARTRRFEVVFVLGLEEGRLPRRAAPASPFLDDDVRRELDERTRARLARPDAVARERFLFYAACTRPSRRLYLVREAATDDGAPRRASPFWDEVRGLLDPTDVARWTRRRPLSALTWPLAGAPTERERLRALAALSAEDAGGAEALAVANGWERRFRRARSAFERPTALTHPAVLAELAARTTFNVTELEAFATCSSIWLVERLVSPRSIDAEVDAKLRGSIAHTTLHRFYAGLPKELGAERVDPASVEDALRFLRRCLDEALGGVRQELSDLERRELAGQLRRDLERFVRDEAASEAPLVPRRFEVSFGTERSAPELQRGLDLGGFALSGKIDRIDLDPFSARGIVWDYKSGKTAFSAAKIDSELRLQIPLYMLVLRDLVGIEPLGGLYRALAGDRDARGLLRAEARDDGVPGFARNDYRDEDDFWAQIDRAAEHARGFVGRIRAGDVRHDPHGDGGCPSWCDLAPMCRVRRS